MAKFKFYHQLEVLDCGPSCLKMILHHYGKNYSMAELRQKCNINRSGVTLHDISKGAKETGFSTLAAFLTIEELYKMPLPCILHWNQEHFVVLYKIVPTKKLFYIADPGYGNIKLSEEDFKKQWQPNSNKGVALLLEPAGNFNALVPQISEENQLRRIFSFLHKHLIPQKSKLIGISLLLILASLATWLFPYLLSYMIDNGVSKKDINIVFWVLLAQVVLFVSQLVADWLRGMVSVHLSTQLSMDIILDFVKKLVKLPINFFDNRLYTDIIQRLDDHNRIEEFLSYMVVQFIFSLFTFVFLSYTLASYNIYAFGLFMLLSVMSTAWVWLFLGKRQIIDYARFHIKAENRNVITETIMGMTEIKINNAQAGKIQQLSNFQQKLYYLNVAATRLYYHQQVGAYGINQLKGIIITGLCAYWVIEGQLTLGAMMSISYIMGQLSQPLQSFIDFFRSAQDAKIAFSRLDEIQRKENENVDRKINVLTNLEKGIQFDNVSFKYDGSHAPFVLQNISLNIPAGKVTAIVGESGSGKTTLLKLLLNFYAPQNGTIIIDDTNICEINPDKWRDICGIVLQEGHIFSGTIAENIALGKQTIDYQYLEKVCQMACLSSFIDGLPLGVHTKIGKAGIELSGGQKQRILIARAVYKNPECLFFDEATSSLDANNERVITENLQQFYKGKTVVVIAHRLSTVKNADQIITLHQGKIVEIGSHTQLAQQKGYYYQLIKNQLELSA
ncbi:MAG: peptidase domain-containing ABC transporter [Chitinophagales bacterium]|nr:peptidase domain-containing ABC transporter [Chitinophagales bacterium]